MIFFWKEGKLSFCFCFHTIAAEDHKRHLPSLQLEQDFRPFRRTWSSISLVPQISPLCLVCCNDNIFAKLFTFGYLIFQNKRQINGKEIWWSIQMICNIWANTCHSISDETINSQRLNNVPVTTFPFFLKVQSLFPLQGDFLLPQFGIIVLWRDLLRIELVV